MSRINPLIILSDFINDPAHEQLQFNEVTHSRADLRHWILSPAKFLRPPTLSVAEIRGLNTPEKVDLAIDCLIAAGIGNEVEQGSTVHCSASY